MNVLTDLQDILTHGFTQGATVESGKCRHKIAVEWLPGAAPLGAFVVVSQHKFFSRL